MHLVHGSLASAKSPLKTTASPSKLAQPETNGASGNGSNGRKIRTLVADPETAGRELLRGLLQDEKDIEILGVFGTGQETAAAINQCRPELVFLDVNMPGLTGFEVLKEVRCVEMPAIIFLSGTEEFAAKAFDVQAMDYLVKPCSRERLQSSLQRVRAQLDQFQTNHIHDKLDALLADLRREPRSTERIAIKSGGRILFVRLGEVDWIEAADNYVNLHTGQVSHLLRETMNGLEARLSPRRFVRISRSAMVNIEHIKELQPAMHGDYVVVLANGTKLTVTRAYREKLRELSMV
jgi:two-component system LytT family response regulator